MIAGLFRVDGPSADSPSRRTRKDRLPVAAGAGLTVQEATKRFGGVTAVDSVSFQLSPGEAMAVIGPNGAGKSSLLKLLSGVYRADRGSLTFGDVDLTALAPRKFPEVGIALAHQIPRPFRGLTVWENVAIGAGIHRRGASGSVGDRVEQVLDQCGLADRAQRHAENLRLLDLKRLEVARALSVDPQLILLDEVAAGLSGRELGDLIELIRRIHQDGRGLVLVEHVEGVVASLVDRVVVMDWGKVIAEGTPAEVSADPTVRKVYLGGGRDTAKGESHLTRPVSRTATGTSASPLLQLEEVKVRYGDITALRGLSLQVRPGEVVGVLGANGAGKSSLAGAISGAVSSSAGRIYFDGSEITAEPSYRRARRGIAHCPEGRRVFAELTIRENLALALPLRLPQAELTDRLASVHELFPILQKMARRRAGTLSGGQQQQLAIGRALMADPCLLVLDEISLGLAPVVIDTLYAAIDTIRVRRIAVVLVEQNVHRCLAVCDRVVVLDRGVISYQGDPEPLRDPAVLDRFYFGSAGQAPAPGTHPAHQS